MHGCPLRLGPYLGGEGKYQKSENMWSFQMTPSNYWYVIFMWAKCLHCVKTEQSSNRPQKYFIRDTITQGLFQISILVQAIHLGLSSTEFGKIPSRRLRAVIV